MCVCEPTYSEDLRSDHNGGHLSGFPMVCLPDLRSHLKSGQFATSFRPFEIQTYCSALVCLRPSGSATHSLDLRTKYFVWAQEPNTKLSNNFCTKLIAAKANILKFKTFAGVSTSTFNKLFYIILQLVVLKDKYVSYKDNSKQISCTMFCSIKHLSAN